MTARRPAVRLLRRVAAAVLLFAVLYAAFTLLDFGPRPMPLLLLVVVGVAALGLMVDGLGRPGPGWTVDMVRPATPPGQDRGLSLYLRGIEHHLTAEAPDPALRQRLARLAALRLEQRHGVTGPGPHRDELLGPDLLSVLDGPVRRLGKAELARCVQRIEEL